MPNKHNVKCRHHIPRIKYAVRNWAEYDQALRTRGSLTLWVTPEATVQWRAQQRTTPGGQGFYSDLAIEVSLMLRLAFHLPLRQTEGLMASTFALLGVSLTAPDHSTVSRRAMSMKPISKGREESVRKSGVGGSKAPQTGPDRPAGAEESHPMYMSCTIITGCGNCVCTCSGIYKPTD